MKDMLDEYDAGIAACKTPAGKFVNHQKGVFTFVHVAESRTQAIDSGAAWSALWYVHAAPIIFKVPRSIWWDQIRAGLNPHLARELVSKRKIAMQEDDPRELEDSPDELPVISLLKRMARGEEVTFEEAHEVAEKLDSVIIGDVEHCRHKMAQYRNIGCDRLLCLTQFGRVPHEAVMRSIRLIGEHLIPHFAEREEMAAQ
jgi:alkanesulfonate monooxygenase SsuD/methylene tetrahydromethanopterin reductase-like flavin-dependent oxidoreductase (luciferase family)